MMSFPTEGLHCPRVFDGIACWEPAPAGKTVTQPCPTYFKGFYEHVSIGDLLELWDECSELTNIWFFFTRSENWCLLSLIVEECWRFVHAYFCGRRPATSSFFSQASFLFDKIGASTTSGKFGWLLKSLDVGLSEGFWCQFRCIFHSEENTHPVSNNPCLVYGKANCSNEH